MTEPEHCPQHPGREITARRLRFNRRFCDLDFEPGPDQTECLSEGAHCDYRSQCMVFARVKRRRRMEKKNADQDQPTRAAGNA